MPTTCIINRYPNFQLLAPAVNVIFLNIAAAENASLKSVQVIVTGDKDLNALKKRYFRDDVFTDTISFNYNEPGQPIEGEIYLSIDRIQENAAQYNNSFRNELMLVLIHSLLHLIGYEDNTATGQKRMEQRQQAYLDDIHPKYLYRIYQRQ